MQHSLAEGDRGGEARGVFVDVERSIEVRDAEAFQREFVVDGEFGAEVSFQKLAVGGFERVDGEWFARFDHFVRDLFEFGEHRLADDRAADVVDFAVDKVRSFALIGAAVE